jgi:tRNA threonylcarbamoyladenosine biosynthesis protein TsaE
MEVVGRYLSHSEVDTIRIAREFVSTLNGGTTILLIGELGAGKTAFVRGLVAGAGGDPDDVSSPTFTLLQSYAGHLTVQHVDLYRVATPEVDDLGLDELATQTSLVAIEWAGRLPRVPLRSAVVHIEDLGADEREIRIERSVTDL